MTLPLDIVGSVSVGLSFFLMLSPIPSLYQGLKRMEIKNLTLPFFLCAIIQSILWLSFGTKTQDFFIILINGLSILAFIIYVNVYIFITQEISQFIWVNFSIAPLSIISYFILPSDFNLYGAVFLTSIWLSTTIPTMREALKTKDAAFINVFLACVSLANFSSWIAYGVLRQNYWLSGQNMLSMSFGFMNLNIYLWAKRYLADNNLSIRMLQLVLCVKEMTVSEASDEKEESKTIHTSSE